MDPISGPNLVNGWVNFHKYSKKLRANKPFFFNYVRYLRDPLLRTSGIKWLDQFVIRVVVLFVLLLHYWDMLV